jgi:hypothetical protein
MTVKIKENQLLYEIAIQNYINQDKKNQVIGMEFPDPNRQWRDYKNEWFAMSENQRAVWIEEARVWLEDWKNKNSEYYVLLLENARPLYSLM